MMSRPDDQPADPWDGAARGTGGRPDRLPDDAVWRKIVLAAHRAAVAAGEDGYIDPVTGLFVMAASYLTARGTCCSSSCRHCPYRTAVATTDDPGSRR